MARLKPLVASETEGEIRKLLDDVREELGMVPNTVRTMASSPAVLEAHRAVDEALAKGALAQRLRRQIALAVSQANGCEYCVAAHAAIAKAHGLSDEAVRDSRRALSPDSKTEAALQFAMQVVETRGAVDDRVVAKVRRAGFGDGEIAEIVANVVACQLTNYLNRVAQTEIDYPDPPALESPVGERRVGPNDDG